MRSQEEKVLDLQTTIRFLCEFLLRETDNGLHDGFSVSEWEAVKCLADKRVT